MTTSEDQFMCLFSLNGEIKIKLNINHPLPLVYNLKIDIYMNLKDNID